MGDAALYRCFLKVSRLEAQLLLERYPECGNLLLRPSGDGADGVSVTTRQMHNGCACASREPWVGRRVGAGAWSEAGAEPYPLVGRPGNRARAEKGELGAESELSWAD